MPQNSPVLVVICLAMLTGCSGHLPSEPKLQVANMTTTPVTGLRIDGVDVGVQIRPGDIQRVALQTEPGAHTYSIQFTPPGRGDAEPLWSTPRTFNIPPGKDGLLSIQDNVLADGEPAPIWKQHCFESFRYVVELPGEPSITREGMVVIAGESGISYTITADVTNQKNLDKFERGNTKRVERDGHSGIFRKRSEGERVHLELIVLADGNLYQLTALGVGDDLEERTQRFFESFSINK